MAVFQISLDDYSHCTLGEDGFLWTTGRHCPGFPQVLFGALVRLYYNTSIPIYRCSHFQAHGLTVCEV
jgi:hypothetical protein